MILTPSVSAAAGASPDDRTRSPNAVFHSTQALRGTNASAITDAHDRLWANPRSTPARSLIRNQPRSSRLPSASGVSQPPASTGRLMRGIGDDCLGDWLMPPPSSPTKTSSDRNRIAPNARMLIATPEMMWSMLNLTTAIAWIMPPIMPPTTAMIRPTHGPHCQAAQPPNQVPRIIMPSRPMLTTPARSE